jgi:hypothetical protein
MTIIAYKKFGELPKGYSHTVEKDGGGRFHVVVVGDEGKKTPLIGHDDETITFLAEPNKHYYLGDVRDSLVRAACADDAEFYLHKHGFSARTKNYLDACKKRIGLIKSTVSEDLTIGDWERLGGSVLNSSDVYLSQDGDSYVAGFQTNPGDTYFEYLYYFKERPSIKKVWDAYTICNAELRFATGGYKEEFKCHGCDQVVHWLDIPGSLGEKIERLEDRWCGNC